MIDFFFILLAFTKMLWGYAVESVVPLETLEIWKDCICIWILYFEGGGSPLLVCYTLDEGALIISQILLYYKYIWT